MWRGFLEEFRLIKTLLNNENWRCRMMPRIIKKCLSSSFVINLNLLTSLVLVQLNITSISADEVLSVTSQHLEDSFARILITFPLPRDYRIFKMGNPDRIVIDLKNTSMAQGAKFTLSENGLVMRVRHAKRGDNDLRVVLDTRGLLRFEHELVQNAPLGETSLEIRAFPSNPQQLALEKKQIVIAIDAGHGGVDSGAVGLRGTYEKEITLDIARRLGGILQKDSRLTGVLTRDSDTKVRLRSRVNVARKRKADLFLSIHADAIQNRAVKGSSVYILSNRGASSELARRLASQANSSDFIGSIKRENKPDDLWETLVDLSQKATLDESNRAARGILTQLNRVGGVHKKKVQSAGFLVLKSLDIPSVLIEVAFISNPAEEMKLNDPTFRQSIAQAVYRGVLIFFDLKENSNNSVSRNSYSVKKGDTLSEIAVREKVSINTLRKINGLRSDFIKEGQTIALPKN